MSGYGLTEAQITKPIQRYTAQTSRDKSTEYALPSEIFEDLKESSSKEFRANIQDFAEEALCIPKIKRFTYIPTTVQRSSTAQLIAANRTAQKWNINLRIDAFVDNSNTKLKKYWSWKNNSRAERTDAFQPSTELCDSDPSMANMMLVTDDVEAQQGGFSGFQYEEFLGNHL
ncbi:hypothetical protein BCV72DRAFT_302898 [Rhizopus microsporus var. microsporus]|uniref:Uncharacterized protein n=1 Tax=Rhizopus microsporus var. microsporus TaxID=86635 RepID=A0A1X0RBA0_RHIZD|nr:hypothetical protein BCV72DRAFT_302898 [Rhizopus microsporus var. microsporus]